MLNYVSSLYSKRKRKKKFGKSNSKLRREIQLHFKLECSMRKKKLILWHGIKSILYSFKFDHFNLSFYCKSYPPKMSKLDLLTCIFYKTKILCWKKNCVEDTNKMYGENTARDHTAKQAGKKGKFNCAETTKIKFKLMDNFVQKKITRICDGFSFTMIVNLQSSILEHVVLILR